MNRFFALVLARLRRDAVADDIREELESHLRARVDEYARAGLSIDEARRKALRRFGNVDVHVHRGYAVRGSGVMETIWQDVQYAVRSLRRQPGFAAVAIATLALGIGASTAIFSVIDAAILRPLPYPAPQEIVRVSIDVARGSRSMRTGPSSADLSAWSSHNVFDGLALWRRVFPSPVVESSRPERVDVIAATDEYFRVLGVVPHLGRTITSADVRPGAPGVAVLSYGWWRSRFGADPSAVGRELRLDDGIVTIIGVLPAWLDEGAHLWRALQGWPRRDATVTMYGRLRPGVSRQAAQQALASSFTPDMQTTGGVVRVTSLVDDTAADRRTTSTVLAAAVASLLLLAWVNAAGLVLARGANRRAEMAIRLSIGAGRGRLFRQLMTESLVLSLAAGMLGVGLAAHLLDGFVANVPMSIRASAVTPDLRVLAFGIGVSLLSGLIAGWWPAFKLARAASPLTRPAAPAGMSRRGGQTLIAAEVALALVLLTGAALMLRSFGRMVSVDIGFDPESFVTMDVVPIAGSAAEHATYYPELLRRLRTLPGVEAVGAINHLPLVGLATITAAGVEGRASVSVFQRTILPGYFEALGLQLVRGRTLTDADMAAAAPVMVAGEATAGLLSPDAPILGRHVQFGRQSLEVIGVVRSVRHSGPLNPGHADLYVPSWISIGGSRVRGPQPLSVVIRPAPGATVTAETLRTVAESLGTRVLVERIRPGGQLFGDRVINPRRRTVLLSLLGGLGLLLALVGIFGVTAYTVARRTREIGVRMAFGARARQVVGTMLRDAVWPVAIGLAVGLAGATFATKVIASFLFETTPTDVPTFAAVAIALAVSAMIAAWIPARRAARVDPVSALRSE